MRVENEKKSGNLDFSKIWDPAIKKIRTNFLERIFFHNRSQGNKDIKVIYLIQNTKNDCCLCLKKLGKFYWRR